MTIKDLSKETGYSVGTISRVLNGQPNVSERARKTIMACVERRGFQLNTNAKRLKQQHDDGILAIVSGTSNELFARMIVHLQRELAQTSYPLTVEYVDEKDDPVQRALRLSEETKPLGLIFLGGDTLLFSKGFGAIRQPSVLLTADASELGFANLSSVTTDDTAAAACAVEYLLSLGHRGIGIISGDRDGHGPGSLRYRGCLRALQAHGLPLPEHYTVTTRYSFADGYAAAKQLMKNPEITAIFAMSDVMAMGAIRALRDGGLRVPEDISVIGFDGIEMGEYYIPKLATIRQQADLLAQRGVALLLRGIEAHAEASHETVQFELITEGSVKKRS